MSQLADKIAAQISPLNPLALETKNISDLSSSEAASIRAALEAELKNRSFRLLPVDSAGAGAQSVVKLQLTLSQSAESYVWIGVIGLDDAQTVIMVSASEGVRPSAANAKPSLTLQRNLLGLRPEPFLDFELEHVDHSIFLVTLQDDSVDRVDVTSGWHNREWSSLPFRNVTGYRDPRGRLTAKPAGDEARIGGTLCVDPARVYLFQCGQGSGDHWFFGAEVWPFNEAWSTGYTPGRNYFSGFQSASNGVIGKQNPFYSAAILHHDHGSSWILTELDGSARLYNQSTQRSAVFNGWGDDIMTLVVGCDSGWHVLVTGAGDWTQPDHLQIYDIENQQAVAVGQPLEFPGPILALWPADDGKSARVVSRNLQTGMYEASIVSVSCGN